MKATKLSYKSSSNLNKIGFDKKTFYAQYKPKGSKGISYKAVGLTPKQSKSVFANAMKQNIIGEKVNTTLQKEIKSYGGKLVKTTTPKGFSTSPSKPTARSTTGGNNNININKLTQKQYNNLNLWQKAKVNAKLNNAKLNKSATSFAKKQQLKEKIRTKGIVAGAKALSGVGKAISGGYSKGWSMR